MVRELNIEFQTGLTAITGETGAGKSIMVDALGLVLGDRADAGLIREGTDRSEICAAFDIQHKPEVSGWLAEQGFDSASCILRRVISKDGRSRAFINGSAATLLQLKELGESLIDIHSQHEHQSLLRKGSHRAIFDAYAEATALAEEVRACYQNWRGIKEKLAATTADSQARHEQLELLQYHLHELGDLSLQPGELQSLEAEQNRLAQAEEIIALGQKALSLCSSGGDGSDSIGLLGNALRAVEAIQDQSPDLASCLEMLQSARIHCEEAISSLTKYMEQVELNPERLNLVEQRLNEVYELARKHRIQPGELLLHQQGLQIRLEALQGTDQDITGLQQSLAATEMRYLKLANELSEKRKSNTASFDKQVSEKLASLGMAGSRFKVELTAISTDEPNPGGLEDIELLISTNPGQSLRPLTKIASGGELSRISLSIQVISAQSKPAPTLVFDEVDVGIGGATAEVVGNMLRGLGDKGQVICVTHQPQVASKAHHHLSVIKNTDKDATDSVVQPLDAKERVTEIARMLGGIKLTAQTLSHAQEMLAAAGD